MADDERRAEIEAVARAWWAHDPAAFDGLTPEWRALQMRRAEAAVVALDRVRDAGGDDYGEIVSHHPEGPDQIVSPSRDGTVAVEDVERLKSELQALVDWFNDAPFLRAERLLYDLSQPEPDALGGLPPSQPKEDRQ